MMENVLLTTIVIVFVYIFFIKGNSTKHKKALNSNTIQELIHYEYITDDGLIYIGDNKYRKIVEIIPTNIILKTRYEQANIWEEYRGSINSLTIDSTEIIQSRIMNISEHIQEIKEQTKKAADITTELHEYGKTLSKELKNEYENTKKRDKKYFIIFKIDEKDIETNENSLNVDNPIASAIMSGKKSKITNEEIKDIAVKELDNNIELISSFYEKANIYVIPLSKIGVIDYLNNTINRDMANTQSIEKLNSAGVFNTVPKSQTIDMFLTKETILKLAEKENENFTYEDEEEKTEKRKEIKNAI